MPAKLDQLQKGILKSLRKQFPNMKDAELKSRSFAIAQDRLNKLGKKGENMETKKEEKKYTEEGYEIVAENVPNIITCNVTALEEEEEDAA